MHPGQCEKQGRQVVGYTNVKQVLSTLLYQCHGLYRVRVCITMLICVCIVLLYDVNPSIHPGQCEKQGTKNRCCLLYRCHVLYTENLTNCERQYKHFVFILKYICFKTVRIFVFIHQSINLSTHSTGTEGKEVSKADARLDGERAYNQPWGLDIF